MCHMSWMWGHPYLFRKNNFCSCHWPFGIPMKKVWVWAHPGCVVRGVYNNSGRLETHEILCKCQGNVWQRLIVNIIIKDLQI